MRDIIKSTGAYESWLRERTDVSDRALKRKHRKMAKGAFPFVRATFYRWVEQWPVICPHLAGRNDDVLLGVGDLHTENFGTWRDSRGRLVWGMNDFDEACEVPLSSDLVRLSTSAVLAVEEHSLLIDPAQIPELLLRGYRGCLQACGAPILLQGGERRFPFALPPGGAEDAAAYWRRKLDPDDAPVIDESDLPATVGEIFHAAFPPGARPEYRRQKKTGGLGSLGRRRYSALVGEEDGRIGREVKALVPSASYWIQRRPAMPSQTASLLQRVIREPDPHSQVYEDWILRQLAPNIAKIELGALPTDGRETFEPALLEAMGWETANIHLGSRSPAQLMAALQRLEAEVAPDWLRTASFAMAECMREDYRVFAAAPLDE
jgi:Uncharacterized protein conserved in bacteria (DUF2252)